MHRILSIDGGGARGLIPARILAYLEERLVEETGNEDLRICDVFDFIAGTSVGGVLALIYLTPSGNGPLPYTAREVWQQLARMLPGVFSVGIWKKINTAWGLGGVKYDDRRLDTWLRFFCSQTMLSQIDKPCLITAYDFRAQSPVYFRSHMARQNPSDNFSLFDVGRSTCAAPSYFAPHEFTDAQEKRSYFCSDGILFAYNPALAAYAEVRKMSRQHNAAHMYIVSLGTGESPDAHDPAEINDWGGLQWGVVIGKLMADCTSRNVDEQLRQVFRDSLQNYVRLNPDLAPDCSADMDCVRPDNLQALVACAENYIENNREKLEEVVAVLSRTYIESRTPSAAPPLPLQHAGTDYAALWQQSIPAYHAGVNAPGQNALAFENDRFALSYARLNDCLNHLRTGLSMRLYTRRGSRAIIAVQDGLSAHVIARALIILGASFCLYREKLSPSQLARALVRGGQVLFIDEAQLNAFAAADFTKLSVVSVGADDFAGTARIHQRIGTAVSQLLHRLQVAIGAAASAKAPGSVIGLRQLLSVASKKQPAASGPEAADCAWMNEDDGRAWSQRNLVVSAAQLYSLISRFAVPAEHSPVIILGVHPCSHTAVTVAQVLAPRLGARVIFAPHPISMYSASRVWNDADRLYIFASPQWFVKLIDDGPARASLGRIRFAAVVGSGLPPSLARQWSKLSSAPLVLAWTQAAGEAVLGWADAQDAQTIAPLEAVEFYSIRNKPPQQDEAEGTAPRATEAGADVGAGVAAGTGVGTGADAGAGTDARTGADRDAGTGTGAEGGPDTDADRDATAHNAPDRKTGEGAGEGETASVGTAQDKGARAGRGARAGMRDGWGSTSGEGAGESTRDGWGTESGEGAGEGAGKGKGAESGEGMGEGMGEGIAKGASKSKTKGKAKRKAKGRARAKAKDRATEPATEPPQGTEPGTERDNATHTATAATAYAKAGTSTATATAATATAATAYAAAGTSTLATQGKPNDAAATQATSSEGAGESAGESAGATTRDGTEAYRVESAEEGEEIICARGAHLPEWQLRQTFSAAPTDSSEIGKAKGLDKDGNLLLR